MKPSFAFISLNQKIARLIPLWTQGAGSNLSEKISDKKMLIKASGFRLDQVTQDTGFVELNYHQLKDLLLINASQPKSEQEAFYSEALMTSKFQTQNSLRPSMEAGFHALSKYKFVLHFHSLAAVLMGAHPEWMKANHLYLIPLVNPGWELSQFFIKNDSELNILMNHGVILQSNTEGILQKWDQLENSFLAEFNYSLLLSLKKKITTTHQYLNQPDLASFLKGPLKFYFPDMAIYFQKLKPFLIPDNVEYTSYTLSPEANTDLQELWIATQILFQSNPQLTEMPETMIESITKLPTEKLRQTFIKG